MGIHPSRATLYLLYTSLCTGELNAIREKLLSLQSFLQKGVLLGSVIDNIENSMLMPMPFQYYHMGTTHARRGKFIQARLRRRF